MRRVTRATFTCSEKWRLAMSDINELNSLWEEKADVELKLKIMVDQEASLREELNAVITTKVELIRRKENIQEQAAKLCEELFGSRPAPVAIPVQANTPPVVTKTDNSIVSDFSSPVSSDKHVAAVEKLGGFSF